MRRAAALSVALVLASCGSSAPGRTRSWPVMGTIATATIGATGPGADPAIADAAIVSARASFDRVNAVMSNWSASSELSMLNREAGRGPYAIRDAALARCVAAALDAAGKTGGAFDPTVGPLMTAWGFRPHAPRVPTDREIASALALVGAAHVSYTPATRTIRFDREGVELDLGGIAKGCALDDARDAIAATKTSGLLDLGGNLAWFGDPRTPLQRLLGGGATTAAIVDPNRPGEVCARVRLGTGYAVATSSDVENHFTIAGVSYGHIMDPRTGRPSTTDVVQATAIDRSGTVADILSTALFVGGSARAPAILAAYPTAQAVLLVREGDRLVLIASASLSSRLEVTASAGLAAGSPRLTLPAANMASSHSD